MQDQVSRTALYTAFSRGFHFANDQPLIFSDPHAFSLLSPPDRTGIENRLLKLFRSSNPRAFAACSGRTAALGWLMQAGAAAAILLSRAQYAEECLAERIGQGVGQYVNLGAGLDSFAYRRPDHMEKLLVYEVDHPATQEYKRRRLVELAWRHPEQLRYVPLDFTRQGLGKSLAVAGFDSLQPAFFSWLGVAYYLPRRTVLATLTEIAELAAPGSSLVFDFLDESVFVPSLCAPRVQRMLDHVALLGEPMLSGFDPLALSTELDKIGLTVVGHLYPLEIHNRWFLGRTDHYRACEQVHFVHAVRK